MSVAFCPNNFLSPKGGYHNSSYRRDDYRDGYRDDYSSRGRSHYDDDYGGGSGYRSRSRERY